MSRPSLHEMNHLDAADRRQTRQERPDSATTHCTSQRSTPVGELQVVGERLSRRRTSPCSGHSLGMRRSVPRHAGIRCRSTPPAELPDPERHHSRRGRPPFDLFPAELWVAATARKPSHIDYASDTAPSSNEANARRKRAVTNGPPLVFEKPWHRVGDPLCQFELTTTVVSPN